MERKGTLGEDRVVIGAQESLPSKWAKAPVSKLYQTWHNLEHPPDHVFKAYLYGEFEDNSSVKGSHQMEFSDEAKSILNNWRLDFKAIGSLVLVDPSVQYLVQILELIEAKKPLNSYALDRLSQHAKELINDGMEVDEAKIIINEVEAIKNLVP